jgi:hypothetical protein
MKKLISVATVLAALVLAAPSVAPAAKKVTIQPGVSSLQGTGWAANALVTVKVTDKGGATRIDTVIKATGTGSWSIASSGMFSLGGGGVDPGDTLAVSDSDGSYQVTIPTLSLTAVDLNDNVVAGRFRPAIPSATLSIMQFYLAATGIEMTGSGGPITVGADGSFSVDTATLTPPVLLRRTNWIVLAFTSDIFSVSYLNAVPGVFLGLGSNWVTAMNPLFIPYTYSLYGPGGVFRAQANSATMIGGDLFVFSTSAFRKKSGLPIRVGPGDTLRVTGPFANFSVRVPPVNPVFDIAGRKISGRGYRGRPVHLLIKRWDPVTRASLPEIETIVAASDLGAWEAIFAEAFAAGDRVTIIMQDKLGNFVTAEKWIPAAP